MCKKKAWVWLIATKNNDIWIQQIHIPDGNGRCKKIIFGPQSSTWCLFCFIFAAVGSVGLSN